MRYLLNGMRIAPTAEQCFEMLPSAALNTNVARFLFEKVDQTDDAQLHWRDSLAYIRT